MGKRERTGEDDKKGCRRIEEREGEMREGGRC